MKVQEGSSVGDDNRPSAESEEDLRAYFARKRSIAVRSVCVLLPICALAGIWSPMFGFDLALGGTCGVVNMLLIMRNNELLLSAGRSRSAYGLSNTLRIGIVGFVVSVFAVAHYPWWYMLIAIAGFFVPLVLYSLELRRELLTG